MWKSLENGLETAYCKYIMWSNVSCVNEYTSISKIAILLIYVVCVAKVNMWFTNGSKYQHAQLWDLINIHTYYATFLNRWTGI